MPKQSNFNYQRVVVMVEMNLRDWASFEDLALQKDIEFNVKEFKPVKHTDTEVEQPRYSVPRKKGEYRRKPGKVTVETIKFVEDHPNLSNVAISKIMPDEIRVGDSTISNIRHRKYNHIKVFEDKR